MQGVYKVGLRSRVKQTLESGVGMGNAMKCWWGLRFELKCWFPSSYSLPLSFVGLDSKSQNGPRLSMRPFLGRSPSVTRPKQTRWAEQSIFCSAKELNDPAGSVAARLDQEEA